MRKSPTLTRYACYISNASMAAIFVLPPLLFTTFHELYGISYTLLGLLVLINFCSQLAIDLVFSFYSHKFNIRRTVCLMPLLSLTGFVVYAALPMLFPRAAYGFLVAGTVIFSCSGGLAEVLISPVIAALPSDDPERDMSLAHSLYAWGVVLVTLVSTGFLQLFGRERWYVLVLLWAVFFLADFLLFFFSEIPALETPKNGAGTAGLLKNPVLFLCVVCIFLGGASENTMSQWCSGYLESALGVPKIWGDVFGVALFALMLGLGRTLYSKFGRNVSRVLLLGFAGAGVCYLTAALARDPIAGLLACAFTGLCVSMLWPGTLICMAEYIPHANVAAYALLAAGGDLGSSIAPQLVGSITDTVAASGAAAVFAPGLTPEQAGFKAGMLAAALFPLAGALVTLALRRVGKKVSAV